MSSNIAPAPAQAPGTKTRALWNWDLSGPVPTVITYSNGQPTKTGLLPQDLRNFVGVPVVYNYNPPVPLTDSQLIALIRQSEDEVEAKTGVTLCQSWFAAPVLTANELSPTGVITTSNSTSGQVLGIDYDRADVGYDFFYRRYLMEGWGVQQLRYLPLQNIYNASYIYPLLSEFFQIPLSWIVQEQDFGFIRLVPAANVQMLPLFAMQLAFMGFAQSLPQAIYLQYVAGLTTNDYANRFNFINTLVLSVAAIFLLNILQGSVNFGAVRFETSVDGLRYSATYSATGAAYAGLLNFFTKQRDDLMLKVQQLIGGISLFSL
jgi:hypothetical protein